LKEEYIQVTTTTASKEDAQRIARALVERRLAACVQVIGPIESTYWWKGKIESAQEWLCVAKTRARFYKRVEKAIKEMHPYEVPEIVAVEIREGSEEYLRWVHEELRLDRRGGGGGAAV